MSDDGFVVVTTNVSMLPRSTYLDSPDIGAQLECWEPMHAERTVLSLGETFKHVRSRVGTAP